MIGAWYALGRKQKGKLVTRAALAEILGCHIRTIEDALHSDGPVRAIAEHLREQYWTERIPDIDEAAYRDAIKADSQAADKKLAYLRAGVLADAEASTPGQWLAMLAAATQPPAQLAAPDVIDVDADIQEAQAVASNAEETQRNQ
jgi:hypothetical protein